MFVQQINKRKCIISAPKYNCYYMYIETSGIMNSFGYKLNQVIE